MAYIFDTLSMAKSLATKGVEPKIAEAISEVIKDYIMSEVATKPDLRETEQRIIIRVGSMFTIGLTILAAIIKLL